MKMGKRKDKAVSHASRRKQILKLGDEQDAQNSNFNHFENYPQSTPILQPATTEPTSVNPLSGLLSHYMDCDDDEDDSEHEETSSPKEEDKKTKENKPIDVEVADFLKEIDALTSEETTDVDKNKEDESGWQECVDENTGYTYYWNVITNQVSWERPKDVVKTKEINREMGVLPGSSNDYSSNEENEKKRRSTFKPISKANPKMGPHLPPDENNLDVVGNGKIPNEKSNDVTSQHERPKNKPIELFIGPKVAQIFPPSVDNGLEIESDNEDATVTCSSRSKAAPFQEHLFPTQEGVSKHRGFGFSRGDDDGGKTSDKISFVKAETLDLNELNRTSVSEWKSHEDDEDIDEIDRELDLALARNVDKDKTSSSPPLKVKSEISDLTNEAECDVSQISNDIFSRLKNIKVNNLQRLLIQTQTRLEDWRKGALTRNFILTKLRQIQSEVHRLVTLGDRPTNQTETLEPTTVNNKSSPITITSGTESVSPTSLVLSLPIEPPPLPPARECIPPPPPPDTPPPQEAISAPMELEEAESDLQMELNSFYSDIGIMNETAKPPVPIPAPSAPPAPINVPTFPVKVPTPPPPQVTVAPLVKKEKKLKKARIATGLVLKKKNMPYLVEKWQKINWEESQIMSSDEESGGMSTNRD